MRKPGLWGFVGGFALGVAALSGCGGSAEGTGGGGGTGGGAGGSTSSDSTTSSTFDCTSTGGQLGDGECRFNTDCSESAASCVPPGAPQCGGAGCALPPCGVDSDCAGGDAPSVCEIEECCGDKRCVPGCTTDADCPVGLACNAERHCVPQPCDTKACPDDFDCGDGVVPSCTRRACSCDAQCEGTCVLGNCHTAPGTCQLPVP